MSNKPTLSIDEILQTLWVKAELYQHRLERMDAVDIRKPDTYKADAKAQLTSLIRDKEIEARIDELSKLPSKSFRSSPLIYWGFHNDERESRIADLTRQRASERGVEL